LQIPDLKLQVLDILEGAYSYGNVPDVAFIQEFVGRHKKLAKYAYRGTPDIRVIVFNKCQSWQCFGCQPLTRVDEQSSSRGNLCWHRYCNRDYHKGDMVRPTYSF